LIYHFIIVRISPYFYFYSVELWPLVCLILPLFPKMHSFGQIESNRVLHLFLVPSCLGSQTKLHPKYNRKFNTFLNFLTICNPKTIIGCECWGPGHIMRNDAYDTEIWHMSIWTILVSKEASGPQHLHPMIWIWLKNVKNMKMKKCVASKTIPFINIWNQELRTKFFLKKY
jgi:hypothetical protein